MADSGACADAWLLLSILFRQTRVLGNAFDQPRVRTLPDKDRTLPLSLFTATALHSGRWSAFWNCLERVFRFGGYKFIGRLDCGLNATPR
jgi:hypothetical protein